MQSAMQSASASYTRQRLRYGLRTRNDAAQRGEVSNSSPQRFGSLQSATTTPGCAQLDQRRRTRRTAAVRPVPRRRVEIGVERLLGFARTVARALIRPATALIGSGFQPAGSVVQTERSRQKALHLGEFSQCRRVPPIFPQLGNANGRSLKGSTGGSGVDYRRLSVLSWSCANAASTRYEFWGISRRG